MRRQSVGVLLVGLASLFAGPARAADAGPDPRAGIVRLERAGTRLGFGMVLRSDGRILTALSALGHGNYLRARFSDEHVLAVHVVATDRAWDLALLTPMGDARRVGLKASREPAPTAGTKLHALSYVRDKQLGASDVTIKSKGTLRGGAARKKSRTALTGAA